MCGCRDDFLVAQLFRIRVGFAYLSYNANAAIKTALSVTAYRDGSEFAIKYWMRMDDYNHWYAGLSYLWFMLDRLRIRIRI